MSGRVKVILDIILTENFKWYIKPSYKISHNPLKICVCGKYKAIAN
jgi:hypothetical protein